MIVRRLYDLVLFDLDGTLLDTSMDLGDSMNSALQRYGYPALTYDEYKRIVGDGVANLCARSLELAVRKSHRPFPEGADKGSVDFASIREGILAAFREHYKEHLDHRTKPYSGIPEVLEHLQDAGVLTAVLSNKSQEFTRTLVASHFPDIRFCYIIGDGGGFPRKPDPAAVLHILESTGCLRQRTILFGDGEADVLAAKAAGIDVAAASWGFRPRAVLAGAGATRFVDAPSDIIPMVIERIDDEQKP